MDISKDNFLKAATGAGIDPERAEACWNALQAVQSPLSSTPLSKLLFYAGSLVVIASMTWLMTLGWETFGDLGMLAIAMVYSLIFTFCGSLLWNKSKNRGDLRVPGGLFITMAVCMTPLIVYSLQSYLHLFPEKTPDHYTNFYYQISSSWIWMELATIFTGMLALHFVRFPFLTLPIFVSSWFFTMDVIPLLVGNDITWDQKNWISLFFGIILLSVSCFIDQKSKKNYAFWGYLFGTLVFWGALSSLSWESNSEIILFIYLILNLFLMIASIVVKRKILLVFGVIGFSSYLGHLAYDLFKNSIGFPFALSAVGLLIIYSGLLYQKHRSRIESYIIDKIPVRLRIFFHK